jgi:hypothetical protein
MLKLDGAMPKIPCAAQQMFQSARSYGGDPGKMTGRLEGRCPPMRKISSSSTVFYKYVFPVIWFGGCGLILALATLPAVVQNQAPIFIVLPPIVMMVIGYILMRALIFDLVDEVFLNGDEIIIRNGGEVDQFAVTNILNVDSTVMTNPERITLTLKRPCAFGSEVTFSPTMRFWMFQRHPIARELIELAHRDDG